MARFGLAPAAATRDLALYREVASQNIEFDGRSKSYRIAEGFVPVFEHAAARVLSALSQGFGDGITGSSLPDFPCEIAVSLSRPDMALLAPICRALHAKSPVAIRYHSLSSGETERVIVPSALIDTGQRWHVRAYDRKSQEFRDFVVTRIQSPNILAEENAQAHELSDHDEQWTRFIDLELVPHPDQTHPEITALDYGMTDGVLRVRVRAAMAGYLLRRWCVDCSPDHLLRGHEYRLWLKDRLALYVVKNAVLAPGYNAITKADS